MNRRDETRGAVLILVTLMLFVLFGFAAIAVDVGFSTSLKAQGYYYARLAALGAIQGYYAKDSENRAERLQAALDRAKAVSNLNLTFTSEGKKALTGVSENEADTTTGDTSKALLVPGRYVTKNVPGVSDPCGDGSEVPCFKRVSIASTETIDAFRVFGTMTPPGATFFARAFSKLRQVRTDSDAVAVSHRRKGCFLVDLSSSITRETHLERQDPGDPLRKPAEYAFYLASDNSDFTAGHQEIFNALPLVRGADAEPTHHYQSDYQKFSIANGTVFDDADYAFTMSEEERKFHWDPAQYPQYTADAALAGTYTIDTVVAPQPLADILSILGEATDMIAKKANDGDEICIIGFDNYLIYSRILKLSKLDDKTVTYVKRFADMSSAEGKEFLMQRGFFPIASGNTNISAAIGEAVRQFSERDDPNTSNFIVLISDGAQTCAACPKRSDMNGDGAVSNSDVTWWDECQAGTRSGTQCAGADINGDGNVTAKDREFMTACTSAPEYAFVGCNNDYNYYNSGMKGPNGIFDLAQKLLFPSQIPLHALIISDQVGPHTVDVADSSDPNKCLSHEQIRALENKDMTKGFEFTGTPEQKRAQYEEAWQNMLTKGDPFFQIPNDWDKVSRITGGYLGMVRPKNLEAVPGGALPAGCEDSQCSGDCCPGKRRCLDPTQRTTTEQLRDFMEKVIGRDTTFVVVRATNAGA